MNLFNKITSTSYLKVSFILILAFQLMAMLLMSRQVGISADESRHINQAEKVYNYFKTDGEDKSALANTGIDPMQYNGQSFDNLMYLITQKFEVKNYIEMRHFFIAIIGWLIILFTGLLAKKIYDYEGAILAVLILFFSPRFLGHSLNNNKDIPFALGFVMSMYGMTGFLKSLPKISYTNIAFITIGIAFAISIRLAGLLSIAFLGFYSAILFLVQKPYFNPFEKNKVSLFKKLLLLVPLMAVAGYFLGIAYWPFMRENPIANIKVIMDATTSHPVGLSQLFEGKLILSTNIPWYYTLRYLSITYPLMVLTGLLLSVVLAPFILKKDKLFLYFMILFAFVFVFFWMSYNTSNFYGGIRHLLFIYPLAVCTAVFGFSFLRELLKKNTKKWLAYLPFVLLAILAVNPISHIIRNYPYAYVYYNELAGGVKKVSATYETDYFQHSLRHATEWFVANELPKHANDTTKIKVVTNDAFNTGYYLRDVQDRVENKYVRYYEKSREEWDYAIFYCGYITPEQISRKLWPPKGTIHTEEVDGFPIAAVVKRVSDEDFKGNQSLAEAKNEEAAIHFRNFLNVYEENEEAWQGLAQAMMNQRKYDSTIIYADKAIEYNPRQLVAMLYKATSQNSQKYFNDALITANKIIQIKNDFAEAHFQRGYALKNLDQPNEALKEFQLAISYDEAQRGAYYQMGEILTNYKNYQKALEIYSKLLEKQSDDFVATISTARAYYLMGDATKAKQIIENVPENLQIRLETVALKCRMALDNRDLQSAQRYLQMARFVDFYPEVFFLRARYALTFNQKQEALDYLTKGIEIDPVNREIKELLASLQNAAAQSENNTTKAGEQQSIMYQKPAEKKTGPITIPVR